MSPEWELFFLSAHAARHRWQGLRWMVDLHEVCTRGGFDWARIREKARRFGWERLLRRRLSSCHALFQTRIPADLLLEKLPRRHRLFPNDLVPQPRQNAFDHLHLLGSSWEKFRYILRVVASPTFAERRRIRLPHSLRFLYYPLRAARVGSKWSWKLIQSVGGVPSWT